MKKLIVALTIVVMAWGVAGAEGDILEGGRWDKLQKMTKDELLNLPGNKNLKEKNCSTEPKIKAMFWDKYRRQYATDKIQIDLDNGQTIILTVGEEIPQYRFKIDSDPKQDKDCRWGLIFQLIDHLKALEKRVLELETQAQTRDAYIELIYKLFLRPLDLSP